MIQNIVYVGIDVDDVRYHGSTLETVEHVPFSELEPELTEVRTDQVDLGSFDCLLEAEEVV